MEPRPYKERCIRAWGCLGVFPLWVPLSRSEEFYFLVNLVLMRKVLGLRVSEGGNGTPPLQRALHSGVGLCRGIPYYDKSQG